MQRIKLTLAYDGTEFSGWQLQRGRGDRTVQGELERVLAQICEGEVRVHGAGRTDAGVHALGQVAHCDVPGKRADVPWQRALNSKLPDDVRVIEAAAVPDDFHARFSATGKTYTYSLWLGSRYDVPQRRNFSWACGPLDEEAMDAAARCMTGTRDFKCFQNVGTPVKSTIRTVVSITRGPGLFPGETDWVFTADGFLKQMVRNMVGLLVAVGRGRFAPGDVARIIEDRDRAVAYSTAPPQGLTLTRVHYEPLPPCR